MNLYHYIVEYGLVLIPALLLIGVIIKKIPLIPNWTIPSILFGLGAIIGCIILNWTISSFVQGFLCGGTAIGLHQLFKQVSRFWFKDCDQTEPDIYEEEEEL